MIFSLILTPLLSLFCLNNNLFSHDLSHFSTFSSVCNVTARPGGFSSSTSSPSSENLLFLSKVHSKISLAVSFHKTVYENTYHLTLHHRNIVIWNMVGKVCQCVLYWLWWSVEGYELCAASFGSHTSQSVMLHWSTVFSSSRLESQSTGSYFSWYKLGTNCVTFC
jgi:hypothetical protein